MGSIVSVLMKRDVAVIKGMLKSLLERRQVACSGPSAEIVYFLRCCVTAHSREWVDTHDRKYQIGEKEAYKILHHFDQADMIAKLQLLAGADGSGLPDALKYMLQAAIDDLARGWNAETCASASRVFCVLIEVIIMAHQKNPNLNKKYTGARKRKTGAPNIRNNTAENSINPGEKETDQQDQCRDNREVISGSNETVGKGKICSVGLFWNALRNIHTEQKDDFISALIDGGVQLVEYKQGHYDAILFVIASDGFMCLRDAFVHGFLTCETPGLPEGWASACAALLGSLLLLCKRPKRHCFGQREIKVYSNASHFDYAKARERIAKPPGEASRLSNLDDSAPNSVERRQGDLLSNFLPCTITLGEETTPGMNLSAGNDEKKRETAIAAARWSIRVLTVCAELERSLRQRLCAALRSTASGQAKCSDTSVPCCLSKNNQFLQMKALLTLDVSDQPEEFSEAGKKVFDGLPEWLIGALIDTISSHHDVRNGACHGNTQDNATVDPADVLPFFFGWCGLQQYTDYLDVDHNFCVKLRPRGRIVPIAEYGEEVLRSAIVSPTTLQNQLNEVRDMIVTAQHTHALLVAPGLSSDSQQLLSINANMENREEKCSVQNCDSSIFAFCSADIYGVLSIYRSFERPSVYCQALLTCMQSVENLHCLLRDAMGSDTRFYDVAYDVAGSMVEFAVHEYYHRVIVQDGKPLRKGDNTLKNLLTIASRKCGELVKLINDDIDSMVNPRKRVSDGNTRANTDELCTVLRKYWQQI